MNRERLETGVGAPVASSDRYNLSEGKDSQRSSLQTRLKSTRRPVSNRKAATDEPRMAFDRGLPGLSRIVWPADECSAA